MNFFFPIKTNFLSCNLTIPRFQNKHSVKEEYLLYSASIENNYWHIEQVICKTNRNFYFLYDDDINKDSIYFLATEEEFNKNKEKLKIELIDLNNFTNTVPDFRANLEIYNNKGGFSSYQSEYPISTIFKEGNILSPISMLLNKKANKNYLILKNIFYKPIYETFKIFFVDINSKNIVYEKKILTNTSNQIEIYKEHISSNIYLFSEKYLGIPIFISMDNYHISMEHTHPPHLYILGPDKFKKVTTLKNKVHEIIKKNL